MGAVALLFVVLLAMAALGHTAPDGTGNYYAHNYPANISEIVRSWGYPCEEHMTVTEDGFILSMFRIPHGRSSATARDPSKPVVLLQHGLGDSAVGWTLNLPYESLSYILADAGFDVWLGSNRGTIYSRHHVRLDPSDPRFWDWTFDELALYDVPAMVEYITAFTGKKSISYVGHSQGTTQAFAAFVSNSTIASKINLFVGLAPVAYLDHCGSFLINALIHLRADEIFKLLGNKEFKMEPEIVKKIAPTFCKMFPTICMDIISLWAGWNNVDLNGTRADFYLAYEPSSSSVKNMIHWAQLSREGKFQRFDYGSAAENTKHYGVPTPPQFDLRKWPDIPALLVYGGNDYLADPRDVMRIVQTLGTPPMVHFESDYAHFDPLLGINAFKLIYPIVVQQLRKFNP